MLESYKTPKSFGSTGIGVFGLFDPVYTDKNIDISANIRLT